MDRSSIVNRIGTAVGRGRRWIMRRLLGTSCLFVYGRRYGVDLPEGAFDQQRAGRILDFLLTERLTDRRHLRRVSRPASVRQLRRVHSDVYLDSLDREDAVSGIVGLHLDEAQRDAFLSSQREQVGGTILACRLALAGSGVVANLGGGFHHASATRGQGFCAYNDVAVAVADRRAAGFDGRVLVIDLDLHDGDGTRRIFADDESVYTFSIHNRTLGDERAVASTCLALGDDVADQAYLSAVRARLLPLLPRLEPRLAIYLAGADPAHDDRLGNWRISDRGLLERDRLVVDCLRRTARPVPLVILLAGGYGSHAWRHSARFLSTLASGGRPVEPPRTAQLRLAHYRRVLRLLREPELTHEPTDSFRLTEEDVDPGAAVFSRSQRFLGFYSRHGLELALERTGILDKIRRRGLGGLELELLPGSPGEHTMIVRSGEHDDQSVVELRARIDRSTVAGMRLLWLEWLLLQDPSAGFSDDRPPLPGQRYPGLGLLGDVSALLVLICERLELDGMAFVPSHYHVAAQARSYFRFIDPSAQARFLALQRLLEPRSLAAATAIIERGEIRDGTVPEPVGWRPEPMVYPVSEALRRRFDADDYRRTVNAELGRLRFHFHEPEAEGHEA
ncbi:MAG TPA: hypothetical protein VD788_05990 [Candidatus Polarisedimenticolaceae bacterium]|nr:hypothetical protein [Candidatus Polarisedimenticolaceae bacterium]